MQNGEKPTYEELEQLVTKLLLRIAELENQLNKNSRNSSKPPSTDGYSKPSPKNLREKTGKTSGGQKNHEGTTLFHKEEADEVIELRPVKPLCECGGAIKTDETQFIAHQVLEMAWSFITKEFRQFEGKCALCGKSHKQDFPQEAAETMQYGDMLRSFLTYLNVYQLLPLKRITELVEDVFGMPISQGTIVNTNREVYKTLKPYEEKVKENIKNGAVAHFDETGMRNNGKTEWLHAASTEDATYYFAHPKRGVAAMDAMGILPNFTGVAVHDHWKPYYAYELCAHAECNAHILRYLIHLAEDQHFLWAEKMIDCLLRIKRHVELLQTFDINEMERCDIERYEKTYNYILLEAAIEDQKSPVVLTARGKEKKSESAQLASRLETYSIETLTFMYDFNVPFDNNLVERDMRMPKGKQKISGSFRSEDGFAIFARIRGFVSTTKKRGKAVLEGLHQALQGRATDYLDI